MERLQISPLFLPFPLRTPWLLSSRSSPALPWLSSLALSPWFAAVGESSGKTKKGKPWDLIRGSKCCFERGLACFWQHSPANTWWGGASLLLPVAAQCKLWQVPMPEPAPGDWLGDMAWHLAARFFQQACCTSLFHPGRNYPWGRGR